MVLTIDIGNTNITLGAYKKDELVFILRLSTDRRRTRDQYAAEFHDLLRLKGVKGSDFSGAIIGSVVPELTRAVKEAVEFVTGRTPLMVGPGIKTGLNIRTDDPGELGADLVAGAVAAIEFFPLPCLVMDLGTATKISVIDEKGVFRGCTIAAGVGISVEALATRTSQLPGISLSAPSHTIGTNTIDCMQSGTVFGTAAMLDGMADRIEDELGCPVKSIVATGGFAGEIVRNCRRKASFDGDLILKGLKLLYDRNSAK